MAATAKGNVSTPDLAEVLRQLEVLKRENAEKDAKLADKDAKLADKDAKLAVQDKVIVGQIKQLAQKDEQKAQELIAERIFTDRERCLVSCEPVVDSPIALDDRQRRAAEWERDAMAEQSATASQSFNFTFTADVPPPMLTS